MSADEDARDNDEPHERPATLNGGEHPKDSVKVEHVGSKPRQNESDLPATSGNKIELAAQQPELDDFGLPKQLAKENESGNADLDDVGLPNRPQKGRDDMETDTDHPEAEGETFHDAENEDNETEKEELPGPESSPVDKSTSPSLATAPSSTTDAVGLGLRMDSKSTDDAATPATGSKPLNEYEHSDGVTGNLETSLEHPTPPKPDGENPKYAPDSPVRLNVNGAHGAEEETSGSPTETHSSHKVSRRSAPAVSEWSHQRLATAGDEDEENDEDNEWKAMPALSQYDVYDDNGRLVAKGTPMQDDEEAAYGGLGGAVKGYTRVQLDEDAQSATSMDDDTRYLFKDTSGTNVVDDEEEQRDPLSQLDATKDLLTESQRIAYVGVTRLAMYKMTKELEGIEPTKPTRKDLQASSESMKKWGQQMMVRLYGHMDISSDEQVMIESLAEHGVEAEHLSAPLMQPVRVENPMAEGLASPRKSVSSSKNIGSPGSLQSPSTESPPPYEEAESDIPEVRTPSQLPTGDKIDLDLRWTVLCDLFLVLISDSRYDSRSRLLLERVAAAMKISWVQVCRFEKRVIDALEMQEEADKENWNEEDHMENRRKMGLRRKYMVMGIATAGGALVIGLSAGLLAPVIGAGLAAGFTTIGVTGTGAFLAGAGGTALITSAAVATGGSIAVRASHRRTGAVKTFEYRPLHNNKRLNLILTISGWMNGKVDDVRLPYSTVDPIMGDVYSLLWEPEMLQSMGDTINILATEALTQTIQQVLGSTILVALMASLQLPIVLTKLSYLIDNPWSVSLDRANLAGLILADSLIDRHLGNRPITLVGFSLGSRVIFSCLKELASRRAYGLIQNVYLFGSPIVVKKDEYLRARTVVSGRFVNGYASNDWILGYLFRATGGGLGGVAGLAPVEDIPGLENFDVTELVPGHMAYRASMPRLLREVGWEVTSDEFTEIEDPDPENHAKRQRELIREIEEARKEAEEQSGKKRFGFFGRRKPAQKKGWETYNQDEEDENARVSSDTTWNGNVLFDIEAIKTELESEMIEVKELDSTLPPMRLELDRAQTSASSGAIDPRSHLRQTQSSEATLNTRTLADEAAANGNASSREPSPNPSYSEGNTEVKGKAPAAGPDDVQMTFEPSFHEPRELKSTAPPLIVNSFKPRDITPDRPAIKASETTPSGTLPTSPSPLGELDLERNAWADEEEESGKEKEMQMTFE